jgi:hypothetical protein
LSLETFEKPGDLYLARGEEVNPLRPLFTGDIVADVAIPGVQEGGMAVVVAHPCSMRGKDAQLEPRVLVAAVAESGKIGRSAWPTGNFGLMPLPDLVEAGKLLVARLDDIGKALTADIMAGARVACLSPFGVNLLQQRFIWRLTRHEVPTYQLQEVSAHVFEEADLLEEWSDTVCAAGHPRNRPPRRSRPSSAPPAVAARRCRAICVTRSVDPPCAARVASRPSAWRRS